MYELHSELVGRLRAISEADPVWVTEDTSSYTPSTGSAVTETAFLSFLTWENFAKHCKKTSKTREFFNCRYQAQDLELLGEHEYRDLARRGQLVYVDTLCGLMTIMNEFPSQSSELPEGILECGDRLRGMYMDYLKVVLFLHQLTLNIESKTSPQEKIGPHD
jgi:hypothetical protein